MEFKTRSISVEKHGPKPAYHFSVGAECYVCGNVFKEGDYTALIPLGPADEESREKDAAGKPYNAVAIEIHWDCCASVFKEEL